MIDPRSEPAPRTRLPGSFAPLAPAQVHEGSKGSMLFYQVARDIVFTQAIGHMDKSCALAFKAFGNQTFDRAPTTTLFHDWEEMSGYDSEARALLTQWTIDRRDRIGTVVVLVRSKLVAMGVATANVATSALGVTFRSHTSRESFEREFLATMRKR